MTSCKTYYVLQILRYRVLVVLISSTFNKFRKKKRYIQIAVFNQKNDFLFFLNRDLFFIFAY